MLNPNLKLNPKLFSSDVQKITTRKGFGLGLLEVAKKNEQIVGLSADLKESTQMIFFAEKFPERYIEVGVAEQNLVTVASGLAAMGKIPFCASYAMFSPGRNWEQIRTSIAYNNRPVKIIGSHAGISVGADGGSHQALEDIALMQVIPNMEVFSACDALEAQKITELIAETDKPAYLRLSREKTFLITTPETPCYLNEAQIFWLPEVGLAQVGLIATGPILYDVLCLAKKLEKEGIKTKVINISSIKPIDEMAIIALAKETRAIVTVEEHQKIGGLGSIVADVLAQNYPVPIEFVGIDDQFGQSGNSEELFKYYGLDQNSIEKAVLKVLKRKS